MAEASVIGQGTVVRGNVHGEGSLEIFGRVDGDVAVTGDVTLGEHASVRGNVDGARLTIGGTVTGDLRGGEAVVLERTAQVTGDIAAPRLGIEEGAMVRGGIRMDAAGSSPASRATEQRRSSPRPAERPAPRAEARPAPTAPQKKQPPAPVVPAFRGLHARKKKVRGQ